MNLQQDPFRSICEALAATLKAQIPTIKNAQKGWPDSRWIEVDGNLPAVFFVQVSEVSKNVVSRNQVHKTTVKPDGTGFIFMEQLRLFFLMQISLFTNEPSDRDALGWAIKQYLVTNYRLALADGEYARFKLKGDHQSTPGETKFYQRDLTFEVTARVLDAIPGTQVTTLIPTVERS